MPRLVLPSALLLLLFASPARSADAEPSWPQWRGPNRDGVAPASGVPARWPKEPKKKWSVEVGEGHSGPVVAGGKVYVFARRDDEERLLCLDAATGKELWKDAYRAPYEMNDAARAHGKGPKSTPVVAGGRVFTLGIGGVLSCLDAQTGKLLWRKEFAKRFPATSPLYGTATSPIVVGDVVVAHVGGHEKGSLAGFDAKTGEVKWSATDEGPGYASPVLGTLAGQPQLVTQTQGHLLAFDPAEGKVLWKLPFTTGYDQNSVTPGVYKDLVIYSGYEKPLAAVRVTRKGDSFSASPAWTNKDWPLYMSSPVLAGDRLIGMSMKRGGTIFCVNAGDGKTIWQSPGRVGENAALIRAGDLVLIQTTGAKLVVVRADAERYEPVADYAVADSPTWAHPALAGKVLFVKDKARLTAWGLEGE